MRNLTIPQIGSLQHHHHFTDNVGTVRAPRDERMHVGMSKPMASMATHGKDMKSLQTSEPELSAVACGTRARTQTKSTPFEHKDRNLPIAKVVTRDDRALGSGHRNNVLLQI